MGKAAKIYWFEPIVFLFFGVFHLHRIWGLLDRESYALFWMSVMNNRDWVYFVLMTLLSVLCIAGIIVFLKNIGKNYWWRWIYLFGGGYVLFDLFAILIGLKVWQKLLIRMFDTQSPYWNLLWGFFVLIGLLSFALGIHILKTMKSMK